MTSTIRLGGLIFAAALAACGQTGALYLPDEEVKTPVEIRAPAAPPVPAEEPETDDKEKKSAPPPAP